MMNGYKTVLLILVLLSVEAIIPTLCAATSKSSSCSNAKDFQCKNGMCIKQSKRCNGKKDCKDGSDELDCKIYSCDPPSYKCTNSTLCIDPELICNGESNCPLHDDELNCESHTSFSIPFILLNHNIADECGPSQFQCTNGICVPLHARCDGKNDCYDNSDETIGCRGIEKTCTGFLCDNKHCLESHSWVCDNVDDCGDNSDEAHCLNECTIEKGHFECADNTTCLSLENVCNSAVDCADGSDEGSKCSNGIAACAALKCPQNCKMLPTGPVCLCNTGFQFNNTTKKCDDIDECQIFGQCSQGCTNTYGSFKCTCVDKFQLEKDGRTCVIVGTEALLLYTTHASIGGLYLTSRHQYLIAKNLGQAVGVTYDGINIYWTDISLKTESIIQSLEDGSNRKVLLTAGLGSPEDLAIDWLTGNIYFSDSELMHIAVCSNDGYFCTQLVNMIIHKPRGIVLDPFNGVMYWTDWGDMSMIGVASMDGEHARALVETDIHWPNGLCLDWPNDRLYWVDAKHKRIESILTNGRDRRIVLEDVLKHPYGIAIFQDRLYWSDWDTKSVQACDKFTGKHRETVISNQIIYDVHIYHSSMQPRKMHACVTHQCSHLCLLNANKTFSCGCPKGFKLSADQRTCMDNVKRQNLLVGIGNYLLTVKHQEFGRHDNGYGEALSIKIGRMAFNSIEGTLFVADNEKQAIYEVNIATKETKELISDNIGNVSAMSFDYLSNNLYWTDTKRHTIELYSVTKRERTIMRHYNGEDTPIALAVLPEVGSMFIALRSAKTTHIDRMSMHGSDDHYHVVESGLGSDGSFTFTFDKDLQSLFWIDEGGKRIEMTDIKGETRHLFVDNVRDPCSIAIVGNDLFWSICGANKLYWSNKHNIGPKKKMTFDKPPRLGAKDQLENIVLVATTPLRVSDHPCVKNDDYCSHICVSADAQTAACLCPTGMIFKDRKNLTCIAATNCYLRCGSGECLAEALVCDYHKDCADGLDELNCSSDNSTAHKHINCGYDEFPCVDGKECIKQDARCDLHPDCRDGSDEENCQHYDHSVQCNEYEHRCPNGYCIGLNGLCDGFDDCGDFSDEKSCTASSIASERKKCPKKMFQCASGQCIMQKWECDGGMDCADGSDEHNKCVYTKCPEGTRPCKNKHCVDLKLWCDGHSDCNDGSDEQGCTNLPEIICGEESDDDATDLDTKVIKKFQCTSNKTICLDASAVCNGTSECPRGEDEANCTLCGLHEFECTNKNCIRSEWRCDNEDDCGDRSDEMNCNRNSTFHDDVHNHPDYHTIKCSADNYHCAGVCIEMAAVCDGHPDCPDGSDENEAECASVCQPNPCQHKCKPTPRGAVCQCRQGFTLAGNHKNCTDINECRAIEQPCAQLCENTVGSFRCRCNAGFMLQSDKKSCKAIGDSKHLIFNSGNQVRKYEETPSTTTLLLSLNDSIISGMDMDIGRNRLYFSSEESGAIYSYNTETKEQQTITEIGSPKRLTIDWISGNVYFVDMRGNQPSIKMCNIDRQACIRLVKFNFRESISALTVDPIHRYVFIAVIKFWVFDNPTSSIYRMHLDGSRLEVAVKNFVHITAVTCDPFKERIYFADTHSRSLHSAKYTGDDVKVLVKSYAAITAPIALSIFEDHIYVLNSGSSQIAQCKMFGNRECDTFKLNVHNAGDLVIVQEARQRSVPDICADNRCTLLCVAAELGAKCLCHGGRYVRPGEACQVSNNDNESIMMPEFIGNSLGRTRMRAEDDGNGSSFWTWTLFIACLALVICVGAYYYRQKYSTRKFNISMHFQNPVLNNVDSAMVKMNVAHRMGVNSNLNEINHTSNHTAIIPQMFNEIEFEQETHDGDNSSQKVLLK